MAAVPAVLLAPTRGRRNSNSENKAATGNRSARNNNVAHSRNVLPKRVLPNNRTRRRLKGSGLDAAAADVAAPDAERAARRQRSQQSLRIHALRSNRRASRAHHGRLKQGMEPKRMETHRALKVMVVQGDGDASDVAVLVVRAAGHRAAERRLRKTIQWRESINRKRRSDSPVRLHAMQHAKRASQGNLGVVGLESPTYVKPSRELRCLDRCRSNRR
jgi:hypothetical protein